MGAVVLLAAGYMVLAPGDGDNQNATYALIRALAQGTPSVDTTRLEERQFGAGDFSYINGHYYAAKSPGLAFEALPAYLVLNAAGAAKPYTDGTKQLWYLGLWGTVLPATILLLMVYRVAERLEPGFGLAAAVTLGLATMILPFATLFFAHSLSSTLVFASFFLLWTERQGRSRLALVWAGGLLAGLAATVEFPVAVLGAVLFFYAICRSRRFSRATAYVAGTIVGGLPTLVFNEWAFGTPFKFSYSNVLTSPGANKAGLYGVTLPSFHTLVELLFARIGLLTLTPVVAVGAFGAALLFRRGHRAEGILIGCFGVAYLLLNASYNVAPFGGDSPGPRFLVPILAFLAVGFASAFRLHPFLTVVLAAGSAVQMVVLTLSHPLSAPFFNWFHEFATKDFTLTSLSFVGEQMLGIDLFLGLVTLAVGLAVLATARPEISLRDAVRGLLVLPGWALLVTHTPRLLEQGDGLDDGAVAALLLACAVAFVAVVLPLFVPIGLVDRIIPARRSHRDDLGGEDGGNDDPQA